MVLTSEIILHNISLLEKVKKEFIILQQYQNCNDITMGISLKNEGAQFNLTKYIEFIDFIKQTESNNQQLFYRKKIKNKEIQEILVKNAVDDDAKKCFSSKGPTTFGNLINSPKWEVFSGESSSRRRNGSRRWRNNFYGSDAIIANFIIQNRIDINPTNIYRVNKFYITRLPDVDSNLSNEISQTNEFAKFLISKLSESEIDFKRLNITNLIKRIESELKNKMMTIDLGEKIKCIGIDISYEKTLTLGKVYDVKDKKLTSVDYNGGEILWVQIINDCGRILWYPYRLFETVKNVRNNALDELLKDI